ncbi:GHKL domain-containing protein, partial [Rhizobium sp. CRIBSB]|nr:GHKL domain-containing protein [Rhizobium sp. CRIBSB]
KHRSLPVVLAQDPEVIDLLVSTEAGETAVVNQKLETLASQMRAAAIYLLDERGVARAASNWRLPTSFVGSDYSFRPYFQNAMREGGAEFFALGTVSGRPGLYVSRRVRTNGRTLGVVVVKVEFDALEAEWRASGEPAYVADSRGVILVTSITDWRFRTLGPLTPEQRRAAQAGQTLGLGALSPLPFTISPGRPRLVTAEVEDTTTSWMSAASPTAMNGWTLYLLTPAGGMMRAAALSAQAVAALLVTLMAVGFAVLLRRRQLTMQRAAAEVEARAELERRIDARTSELRQSNDELNRQIEERRRAEASREILRDELVQANKLATLGQIAAGVAHEINQPVAAIRTHADTAAAYVERADQDGAKRALTRIGDLTARIGAITDELRAFSRKAASRPEAVSPDAAIDGALLLLAGRLREARITLSRTQGAESLRVVADRFRLEQVIVNLAQNAIEALEAVQGKDRVLDIAVARRGRSVEITIRDNGAGIPNDVVDTLFTPFVTTKTNGLGLGLVICRDIVAGFGGELILKPSQAGATFVITLKAA